MLPAITPADRLALAVWFPIIRCHQRVVTAAPERACAASDPKTVCAPPYLDGALTAVSTL